MKVKSTLICSEASLLQLFQSHKTMSHVAAVSSLENVRLLLVKFSVQLLFDFPNEWKTQAKLKKKKTFSFYILYDEKVKSGDAKIVVCQYVNNIDDTLKIDGENFIIPSFLVSIHGENFLLKFSIKIWQ